MSSEKELLNTIKKLVEEKTFSMEGVQAIEQLRVKIEASERSIVDYRSKIDTCVKDNETLKESKNVLLAKIVEFEKREKFITDREKVMSGIELSKAVAEAKSYTLENFMTLLFKNTIVRESVQRQVVTEIPSSYSGGMPQTQIKQGDSDTKTIVKE